MADSRRFVQLSHPNGEHPEECGRGWHRALDARHRKHSHQRKFMQLDGAWIDENDRVHPSLLWAWGEWEAQSKKLKDLQWTTNAALPRRLWEPY